ncbi:MAG: type VI secretion system baseplate subunit TssE [Limnobacter sp.]|nr:type VI secretion system baseplate subunit TssE [Limnobacter sp.]
MPNPEQIVTPVSGLMNRLRSDCRPARNTAELARAIKADIQESLEHLLNTRLQRPIGSLRYRELNRLAELRLNRLHPFLFAQESHREQFRKQVLATIQLFEPRLTDVEVILAPHQEDQPQQLNMTIEANYALPARDVYMQFHSAFYSSTRQVEIRECQHG